MDQTQFIIFSCRFSIELIINQYEIVDEITVEIKLIIVISQGLPLGFVPFVLEREETEN